MFFHDSILILNVLNQDNFVMLCPLHASSKLPNESSESQARRRKSNPRKYVKLFPEDLMRITTNSDILGFSFMPFSLL